MPTLQVQLLGNFQLRYDGKTLLPLKHGSLQSLLAYFTLQPTLPLATKELAATFWPDPSQPDPVSHLMLLYQELSQTLQGGETLLQVTPDGLRWHPELQIASDVAGFEEAIIKAKRHDDPNLRSMHLEEAITLYSGDLLPGCQDHWVLAKRQSLHDHWLIAVRELIDLQEQQGETLAAIAYARRLWQQDPLYEREYQRLIHLHVLQGERASVLATLQYRLKAALRGQGGVVLLEGPAGIGKTSLALACQKEANALGAIFAVGRCYERGVAAPYSLWQELLESIASLIGAEMPLLPEPLGDAPPAKSANLLLNTVTTWLGKVAGQHPLVLLLDDIHWADPDSLNLLEFVTRRIEQIPLLCIATYRSDEIDRKHPVHDLLPGLRRNILVENIKLAPFTLKDTARTVEAHLGPCSPRLASYLQTRAEGHPLFLVELLNDLIEQKLLTKDALGRWSPPSQPVALPTLLKQLISRRVTYLGADAETLLSVAAVVGERWELGVVEAILAWPEETLLAVLERILATRLVTLADEFAEQYQFAHGLIREVLYQQQVARRRKHLHAQIRTLLEARIPLESTSAAMMRARCIGDLAYHSYAAQEWDKAWHYNLEAGDGASQRSANRSALQYYKQALDAAQSISGGIDSQQLIHLYERLGELHTLLNHREQAEFAYSHMLETARRSDDPQAEGRALCQLSLVQGWLHRLDDALRSGDDALRLAEQIGDDRLLAQNHFNLGHLGVISGNILQAQQHLAQAERLARAVGASSLLARMLQNQAYIAIFTGRYGEAERFAQMAVEAAVRSGDALALTGTHWVLGFALTELGDYARARRTLQAGLDYAQLSGESHYLAKLLNSMGFVHNEVGDVDGALHWDSLALAACRQPEIERNWEAECYTLLNLATDELSVGRIQRAEEYRRETEAILPQAQMIRFRFLNRYYLLCAELALARDDPATALSCIKHAAELAQSHRATKNVIKSLLLEGQALLQLERLEEAAPLLGEAVHLSDEIEHGSLRWKSRLRLAQLYALIGRANAVLFEQAKVFVNTIATHLDDDKLRTGFLASPLVIELMANAQSALRSVAESQPAPVQATDFPAGLTAREVEVLRLVAQGATNRQIAEALFISVRTVNAHMINILNKVGCENRTGAAAFAIQHGLVK